MLELYHTKLSPPVRSVLMLIDILKLNVKLIEVDLFKQEHMTQFFLEINPQHTLPTLKDGTFILWDSHAIMIYLIQKFATGDSLYPKDLTLNASVNKALFFDAGILFPTLKSIYFPLLFLNEKVVPAERVNALKEGYERTEAFLKNSKYLAGENYTIADISCIATLSCGHILLEIDEKTYPNLHKWYEECEKTSWFTNGNAEGLQILKSYVTDVKLQQ